MTYPCLLQHIFLQLRIFQKSTWRIAVSLFIIGIAIFLFMPRSSTVWANNLLRKQHQIVTTSSIALNTVPDWASLDDDTTSSIAWGDMDNDGDLDLAVGCFGCPNKVYQNDGLRLQTSPVWSSTEQDNTFSIAWGDIDSDGDLDLVAANYSNPSKIYRNDKGILQNEYLWLSTDDNYAIDVALGDMNGDGKLDLALGSSGKVYLNTGTILQTSASWVPLDRDETEVTRDLAWGDVNSDGLLDLVMLGKIEDDVCSEAGIVRVYLNHNGNLQTSSSGHFTVCTEPTSMALGDVNGDGALDLALGYYGWETTLHLNNRMGEFQADNFWRSANADFTNSLAWGDVDNDGDLDLAVGSDFADRIYINENGRLLESPSWVLEDIDATSSLAWGDVDSDGDLDLAVGKSGVPNRLYLNEISKFQNNAMWNSLDTNYTLSAAWGDLNNDSNLDLALGGFVYLNKGGILSANHDWAPINTGAVSSVAWGDMNGDGSLELALGRSMSFDEICNCYTEGGKISVYLNEGGKLQPVPVWESIDTYSVSSIAWGDVDNDGDLDLATGTSPYYGGLCSCDNLGEENIYLNDSGKLQSVPYWSSSDGDSTTDIAWGDMDQDGDLDLAVSNYAQPAKIYRNDDGILQTRPVWVSVHSDYTQSIAWGDIDGDGDLELVTGNSFGVNRVYYNYGQILERNGEWESLELDDTQSIALGDIDGDGDLDLVVGNQWQSDKLYINRQGKLLRQGVPISADRLTSDSIALGDLDSDGDLDLAVADRNDQSKIYQNLRPISPTYTQPYNRPSSVSISLSSNPVMTFNGQSSSELAPANGYAIPGIRQSGLIPVTYNLFSSGNESVQSIRVYYSLDGSFSSDRTQWRVAKPSPDTQMSDLAASLYPTKTITNTHIFNWDVFGSGFFGQSDNVVLRIEALPSLMPQHNSISGPFQRPFVSTQTFPFRARGTLVRVLRGDQDLKPVSHSIIYRLPVNQNQDAFAITDNSGKQLHTNQQGYLQGRGQLDNSDRLFALTPITSTEKYTVYYTNAVADITGLKPFTVTAGGIQTITVSAANTLILYNLTISLEWDARNDPIFMAQLENDLRRTSQILFDLTNGQAALGDVRIYHDKGFWGTADVVIAASNNQRPNAILGGSVLTPTADVDINGNAIPDAYVPGQVRMGATWNRFGNPNGTLGEDWPRTLAHELGHYLFFVPDNYIGVTPDRQFVQIVDCQGSVMTDPYEESYSEFLTDAQWGTAACQRSVAAVYLGRPDWATITRFYPMLNGSGSNPGPAQLPLAVTRIATFAPPRPTTPLAAPFFPLVNQQGQTISVPDGRGQAYLFKTGSNADPTDDYLIALGTPIGDLVQARGAAPGDRLCVFDYAHQPLRLGCQSPVGNTPSPITLAEVADWTPQIQVRGLTTNTVIVTVTNVSADNLAVQLLPALGVASPEMPMTRQGNAFVQTVTAVDGAYFGFIRIWVPGSNPLKELITEYSATESWDGRARAWGTTADAWGGRARAWGGRAYGWGGRARAWGAPVMSSDGQVSIFPLDNPFANGAQYTLQSVAFPPALPAWLTAVGQAYRIASTGALAQSAILFSYLGRDVPDGYENFLTIYYSPDEGRSWQRLPTDLDTNRNQASAPVKGIGIYLLAATVPSNPTLAAGWNNLGYPIQATQLITEALASVAGKYSVVYTYQAAPTPAWQTFAPDVPAPFDTLVNDLRRMELGHAYWVYATEATNLYWGVGHGVTASQAAVSASAPAAPASYYGWITPGATFAPAVGMRVTATIDGVVCGETTVQLVNGQLGYVIRVAANDPQDALPTCGEAGKAITFTVGDQPMAQTVPWNNQLVQFLSLGQTVGLSTLPTQPNLLYLPLVQK